MILAQVLNLAATALAVAAAAAAMRRAARAKWGQQGGGHGVVMALPG